MIAQTILPIKKNLKAQKTIGSLTSLEVPGTSIPLVQLMLDLTANSVLRTLPSAQTVNNVILLVGSLTEG